MTEDDHEELLTTLAGIEGRFLLSGYRSVLYDRHAEANGWDRVEFDIANHASGGKEKRRMVECVWKNS
jgi:DNA adenine methylase